MRNYLILLVVLLLGLAGYLLGPQDLSDNTFLAVVLASLAACAVTTLGIAVISNYEDWGRDHTVYFMSFAAGVLIAVSFMHIIPKALQMNTAAATYLLAGFLTLYLFNRFLNLYICQEYASEAYAVGLVPMVGIGFHSLIDGVIYSVTFNVDIFTGALAAIGMVLHEFPEGIVTFLLLERGGFGRRKAAWYAFWAAGLSTPLGTLVSFPFIHRISESTLGALLALSAGALIYVGASHLLPKVEQENKRYSIIALVVGVLVAVMIVMTKP
jgi:zinc and cadmium transporter